MSDSFFKAWFVFCALLSVAGLAVGGWAVVTLVQWAVTK